MERKARQQFGSGKRSEMSRQTGQGEGGAGRWRRRKKSVPKTHLKITWHTGALAPAPPRAKKTTTLAPKMLQRAAPSKPERLGHSHIGHKSAKA